MERPAKNTTFSDEVECIKIRVKNEWFPPVFWPALFDPYFLYKTGPKYVYFPLVIPKNITYFWLEFLYIPFHQKKRCFLQDAPSRGSKNHIIIRWIGTHSFGWGSRLYLQGDVLAFFDSCMSLGQFQYPPCKSLHFRKLAFDMPAHLEKSAFWNAERPKNTTLAHLLICP